MRCFHLLIVLSLLGMLGACGSETPPPPPAETAPANKISVLFDRINIGDTRESVERLLGAPFSYQKTESGDVAMYMTGMEDMMAQVRNMQSAGAGSSLLSGILGSVAGLAGMAAGPAGGMAASVGSQVIGMGQSAAMAAAAPRMPDPTDIEMLIINYRDARVVSVQRQSPGRMGIGVSPPEE